jgi:hypothetical protein
VEVGLFFFFKFNHCINPTTGNDRAGELNNHITTCEVSLPCRLNLTLAFCIRAFVAKEKFCVTEKITAQNNPGDGRGTDYSLRGSIQRLKT